MWVLVGQNVWVLIIYKLVIGRILVYVVMIYKILKYSIWVFEQQIVCAFSFMITEYWCLSSRILVYQHEWGANQD